jgi:DNA-binding transcriptional regulator GbsR (MarR family)
MVEEILELRSKGLTISEISHKTGYSITRVCEVIRAQNDKDIAEDN